MNFLAHAPTWVAVLTAIGTLFSGVGLGGLMKIWLDHRRSKRKATDDVALQLVGQLGSRVDKLEGELERERTVCDAQLTVMRHRLNNVAASFDALMMMIELAPERSAEIIALVKERRAAQEAAEGAERAAVAAIVAGISPETQVETA